MSSASKVIESLPDQLDGSEISVRDVLEEMNGRSLLLTVLILIVPNLIPFVNALGITHVTGLLLLIFTVRMMMGLKKPWLPGWLLRMKTDKKQIKGISDKAVPVFRAMEKVIRPRLSFLANGPLVYFYAFILFCLTVVMLLPLPFINFLPALIMTVIVLGLIQKDGVVSAIGAILAIGLIGALVYAFLTIGNGIFGPDKDAFFQYETFSRVIL